MEFSPVRDPGTDEALMNLWMEAFGEDREQILPFFREIFPLCRSFAATEDGILCAMAYALPQTLQKGSARLPAAYLYAVATKTSYRGRGLATGLLRYAEQSLKEEGFSGLMLVPANAGLFGFYEKLGFLPFSCRSWRTVTAQKGPAASVTPAEYFCLREAYLQNIPHNVPPEAVLRHLSLFSWEGGCGAAEKTPEGLVFREVLGNEEGAAFAAGSMGADSARCLCAGEETPYAVAKPLTEDFPSRGYFSFAME